MNPFVFVAPLPAIPLGIRDGYLRCGGSGKSTLVAALRDHLTVPYIDLAQADNGPNIRSTPVTYLKSLIQFGRVFAQANHVGNSWFSYNGRGACPRFPKAKGSPLLTMAFMDPVVSVCEQCHGKRYNDQALGYTFQGKTWQMF